MTIAGKVIDSTAKPLAGANIYMSDENGKVTGTALVGGTHDDGSFILSVPDTARFITISYVGMKPLTVPAGFASTRGTFALADSGATAAETTVTATRTAPTPWLLYGMIAAGLATVALCVWLIFKQK